MCKTRSKIGPGTPYREDAPEALRTSLEKLDFELSGAGGVKAQRAETLEVILSHARREDALTLWHLLTRTSGEECGRVYDRLATLVPPPTGVTREGVLAGNRQMLDLWWEALGLRSASWWRMWKQPPPKIR